MKQKWTERKGPFLSVPFKSCSFEWAPVKRTGQVNFLMTCTVLKSDIMKSTRVQTLGAGHALERLCNSLYRAPCGEVKTFRCHLQLMANTRKYSGQYWLLYPLDWKHKILIMSSKLHYHIRILVCEIWLLFLKSDWGRDWTCNFPGERMMLCRLSYLNITPYKLQKGLFQHAGPMEVRLCNHTPNRWHYSSLDHAYDCKQPQARSSEKDFRPWLAALRYSR